MIVLLSCRSNEKIEIKDSNEVIVKEDNVTEIISTDIEKLSKILDFKTYKPIGAQFKYVLIDNSGNDKRLSVPGPSDYLLEAILYFDEITFQSIKNFELDLEWIEQNHNKDEFNFNWLPEHIKQELKAHNIPNYKGHPDFLFGTGVNGKAWYLDHKILLQQYTN